MQDDCVLKMIVDFAGVDLGVAARSLAQVVEREEAELQEQQQAAAGPSASVVASSPSELIDLYEIITYLEIGDYAASIKK